MLLTSFMLLAITVAHGTSTGMNMEHTNPAFTRMHSGRSVSTVNAGHGQLVRRNTTVVPVQPGTPTRKRSDTRGSFSLSVPPSIAGAPEVPHSKARQSAPVTGANEEQKAEDIPLWEEMVLGKIRDLSEIETLQSEWWKCPGDSLFIKRKMTDKKMKEFQHWNEINKELPDS